MSEQKRPAHEVIIEMMEFALHRMKQALSEIERGDGAAMVLVWSSTF